MVKSYKKREFGQTLVIALIVLALGALLVIPLLRQSITNIPYHQLLECKTLNVHSADAGVEYARANIYNNPSDFLETPLQENFTLNDRTVSVTAEYVGGGVFLVISIARHEDCGQTKITTMVKIDHGAFAYAAAGKDIVKNEHSVIDSEPTTGDGDIRSNKGITIVGPGALVNGSAYAVETIVGEEYITGAVEVGGDQLIFPDPYTDMYRSLAQEGGTYVGNLEYKDGGTHHVGPIYVDGAFKVLNGTKVILDGPIYAVGNLEVKEGGQLEGNHYLFAEGNIVLEGGGYGSDEIPVIISPDGNISVRGPVVDGVLYAPFGNVVIENAEIYGAAAGKQVVLKNSILIYAESLHGRSDLPGSEMSVISYKVE